MQNGQAQYHDIKLQDIIYQCSISIQLKIKELILSDDRNHPTISFLFAIAGDDCNANALWLNKVQRHQKISKMETQQR